MLSLCKDIFLNGPKPGPLLVYFRPFLNSMTNTNSTNLTIKSIDGVFGIRTLDLVGADESTELRIEPEQELYKGL